MKRLLLTMASFILACAGCEQQHGGSADLQAREPAAGIATGPGNAARSGSVQDSVLVNAVEERFPGSVILAHSGECRASATGPVQTGMILQQGNELHAVIAVSSQNAWVITNVPQRVEYSGGAMANFLDEYDSAETRERLEVRCTSPSSDPDISVETNGAFIAHRGEQSAAKHLCFSASAVYNSWVCYWTNPGAANPQLSFVQFNAD